MHQQSQDLPIVQIMDKGGISGVSSFPKRPQYGRSIHTTTALLVKSELDSVAMVVDQVESGV